VTVPRYFILLRTLWSLKLKGFLDTPITRKAVKGINSKQTTGDGHASEFTNVFVHLDVKPVNEMVRRLIHLLGQVDRGGSF